MNIYLDTSVLVKLYHEERLSSDIKNFLQNEVQISSLLISRLCVVEYTSAVWQSRRIAQAQKTEPVNIVSLLMDLDNDIILGKLTVIELENIHLIQSISILNKCNSAQYKLRTLDALQLSVAYRLSDELDLMLTCDKDMNTAADFLGLPIKLFQ